MNDIERELGNCRAERDVCKRAQGRIPAYSEQWYICHDSVLELDEKIRKLEAAVKSDKLRDLQEDLQEQRARWYREWELSSDDPDFRKLCYNTVMDLDRQLRELEAAAKSETFQLTGMLPAEFAAEPSTGRAAWADWSLWVPKSEREKEIAFFRANSGVPRPAPSPSGSPFHLVEYADYMSHMDKQITARVIGPVVPEKTGREKEEDTYFEITGNPTAGKLTTYAQWRAEYLRTGMSLPFERMMELVTQHTRTRALDGADLYDKPRKARYWHDIDGRPHPKPDQATFWNRTVQFCKTYPTAPLGLLSWLIVILVMCL